MSSCRFQEKNRSNERYFKVIGQASIWRVSIARIIWSNKVEVKGKDLLGD